MDIFILREFKKGNSERLPRQLGSTPNGYGSLYFTKPVVCASLIRSGERWKIKQHQVKACLQTSFYFIHVLTTNTQISKILKYETNIKRKRNMRLQLCQRGQSNSPVCIIFEGNTWINQNKQLFGFKKWQSYHTGVSLITQNQMHLIAWSQKFFSLWSTTWEWQMISTTFNFSKN